MEMVVLVHVIFNKAGHVREVHQLDQAYVKIRSQEDQSFK
jgi:hypothetical protein